MRKSALFEAMLAILLIVLLFTMYVMVAAGGPSATEKWAVSGVVANTDNVAYGNVFSCDNGVLYTVDGKSIHAIDGNGSVLWSYAIPEEFLPAGSGDRWTGIKAVADDWNNLYIIVSPDGSANSYYYWQVLAISPDGKLLWNRTTPSDMTGGYADIEVRGGRLYYFTGKYESILDLNGNEVKWISHVDSRPSVDEDGVLYVVPGRFESTSIQAYDPDGSLQWSHDFSEYGIGNITVPTSYHLPVYNNHTLYIWLERGALALNRDGSLKWKVPFDNNYVGLQNAWFDSNGDVYLFFRSYTGYQNPSPAILVLHPDGTKETRDGIANLEKIVDARAVSGGVAYCVDVVIAPGTAEWYGYESHDSLVEDMKRYYWNDSDANFPGLGMPKLNELPNIRDVGDLDTYNLSAYDIRTGKLLWDYTMPLDPRRIVLNASDAGKVLVYTSGISDDNNVTPADWYRYRGIPEGTGVIGSYSRLDLAPSANLLYLNFWSYNFEVPTFYGQAKCVYSGGIYALDKNGKLVWDQSTGSPVTYMEEKNGTIYYGTGDGKITAATVDLAAGAALLAAAYLFIRFFLLGAVSRARDRLDKNDNRNRVFQYVAQNPGATMYDVSRGLGMNPGTARYHLMILGINHRLVAHRTDLKYVRYFPNSGSYGGDEQLAMSLVRREGMRKILGLLLEKPGLSHTQLSRALDMPEGSLSRYMKELSEKGVVSKEAAGGMSAYFINGEHRQAIASMMGRL